MGKWMESTWAVRVTALLLWGVTLAGCAMPAGVGGGPAQEAAKPEVAAKNSAPRADLKAGPWIAAVNDPKTLDELRKLMEPEPAGLVRDPVVPEKTGGTIGVTLTEKDGSQRQLWLFPQALWTDSGFFRMPAPAAGEPASEIPVWGQLEGILFRGDKIAGILRQATQVSVLATDRNERFTIDAGGTSALANALEKAPPVMVASNAGYTALPFPGYRVEYSLGDAEMKIAFADRHTFWVWTKANGADVWFERLYRQMDDTLWRAVTEADRLPPLAQGDPLLFRTATALEIRANGASKRVESPEKVIHLARRFNPVPANGQPSDADLANPIIVNFTVGGKSEEVRIYPRFWQYGGKWYNALGPDGLESHSVYYAAGQYVGIIPPLQ